MGMALLLSLLILLFSFSFIVSSGLSTTTTTPPPPPPKVQASAGVRTESRGNSTFNCSPSALCARCSFSEKSDDEKYHCSTTGYRQAYKCIEAQPGKQNDNNSGEGNTTEGAGGEVADRVVDGSVLQKSRVGLKDEAGEDEQGKKERSENFKAQTTVEDDLHTYQMFLSCLPSDEDEKLGVLGFEGIVLGLLAVSGPLMYLRKRSSFAAPSGMSRVPTSSRF